MKVIRIIFCLLLCAGLLLGAAACEKEPEPVSSESPVSSAPPAVSSRPEESSQAEEPWFIPAPDLIPDGPEEGTPGFEGIFSQNPIDKAYDAAYARAMSFSTMRQACDEAAAAWKEMVEVAYRAALEPLSGQERTDLQEDQDIWARETAETLRVMKNEAGTDNQAILDAAKETVLIYRQRAMNLCRIRYDLDGSLPDFPNP